MTNSNQSSTRPSRPPGLNTSLLIIAVLSLLGFADASYLTADHYLSLPLPCTLHGCETVLTSPYATIGPVPLALLGVLYYLSVLFLAVYIYTSNKTPKNVTRLIMGITSIGILASTYFIYLQVDVIHALCMYCLGSAATTLLLFISSIMLVRYSSST